VAHDVFISYASGDKTVADAVCAALEAGGVRCWIAPRDVMPGIHYGEAIIDAIHECRIMVLVFSSKANLSGHIPKEIERAVSQGSTVMPLRIENVVPAKSLDYFIGSVHWLDALTPPLEAHLRKLVADVQTLLSRSGLPPGTADSRFTVEHPATAAPPASPVGTDAASNARPGWIHALIGGVCVAVAVLGFLMLRSRSQSPPATSQRATQNVAGTQTVSEPGKAKALTAAAPALVPANDKSDNPAPPPAPATSVASTPAAASPVVHAADGKNADASGLPPHGRLLYSMIPNEEEIVARHQQQSTDIITFKDGALEFKSGTPPTGPFAILPVSGYGDFVAMFRVAALAGRQTFFFRFHSNAKSEGYVLRIPLDQRIAPPPPGAAAEGLQLCCRPFDLFIGPQKPGIMSLLAGPMPIMVPAPQNEVQSFAVSAKGPRIVVYAAGKEIAQVTDKNFGPGGINVSIAPVGQQLPSIARLTALELYDPPGLPALSPATLPPHGKLLFDLASNLALFDGARQELPEDKMLVKAKTLEITSATNTGATLPIPVKAVSDFVALIRFTNLSSQGILRFHFHHVEPSAPGDHFVQFPSQQRLDPPDPAAIPVGDHTCCQSVDVWTSPFNTTSSPMMFIGPQPRRTLAALNEEQTIVISVKGTQMVMYSDGREIGRLSLGTVRPGSMSLNLIPARNQPAAVVRLSDLKIYEASAK
jgi:hypothetical protein